MIDAVGQAVFECGRHGVLHVLAVFRVHGVQKCRVCGLEGLGLATEEAICLVGPVQLIGVDVPVPVAEMCDLLGFRQPELATRLRLLGSLAFGDVHDHGNDSQQPTLLTALVAPVDLQNDRRSIRAQAISQSRLGRGLSSHQMGKVGLQLTLVALRCTVFPDKSSQQPAGGVAEDSAMGRIAVGDDPVAVHFRDAVGQGVEYRGQSPIRRP